MFGEAYKEAKSSNSASQSFQLNYGDFEAIVAMLRREYGKDSLVSYPRENVSELIDFIAKCTTDEFLDCAEVFGKLVATNRQLSQSVKKDLLEELNHRFREAGLGYEFVENTIIRVDSRALHAEILKPTLALLSKRKIYHGAEQEALEAFAKFRSGDNKGAVVEALKAFESTMKAILAKRGWSYQPNDTAAKLISACLSNGLMPNFMQTHFGALRTMLESGVPTVRNKTSGHGQGSQVIPLDDHYVSYVLYTALANMKLLIDCDDAIP